MKPNETLHILQSVSWRDELEKEGETKNTSRENSTDRLDRYGYMVVLNM